MKLYEIDERIEEITALLEPDCNGELPINFIELCNKLDALEIERQKKLENVAKFVIADRKEAEAVKSEEQRLAARRKVLENKEKSLMDYLNNACGGKKTDLGIAALSYRKSERVVIGDFGRAFEYLNEKHRDCIRYGEPEISKTDVKALIAKGEKVPGVQIVQGISCSLR